MDLENNFNFQECEKYGPLLHVILDVAFSADILHVISYHRMRVKLPDCTEILYSLLNMPQNKRKTTQKILEN